MLQEIQALALKLQIPIVQRIKMKHFQNTVLQSAQPSLLRLVVYLKFHLMMLFSPYFRANVL